MVRENLYQPFEIIYKELYECPKYGHQHNFFELVYIVNGTGKQCINKNTFDYHAGHMFLITPQDCHSFEVETTTGFFFIRFNDAYIKAQKGKDGQSSWLKQMEYILLNASHQAGCILCNSSDKPLVRAIVQFMIGERVNRELYHQEVTTQLVNSILSVVVRNIAMNIPQKSNDHAGNTVIDIIGYIQQHIYEPEALRADRLSAHFGISEGYLGRYFRKHTGESMQQYITNYKLKLIETRLRHSDMRINEIVTEFGFTDESHLNRIFRKYKGINPSEFRKMNKLMPG
jgi:AraC-like DNA-binding protein